MASAGARAALLLALTRPNHGLDNGLGRTPLMGYNTWDDFRCTDLTAENIKKVAAAIVENPHTFPDGMGAVVDAVHAHGLKFGIYTDRGTGTCEGRPGSQGFEEQDAQTYAQWGVDYLKEDSCNAPLDHATAFQQYAAMRDA